MKRKGERTLVLYSLTYYPITKSEPDRRLRAKPAHFVGHLPLARSSRARLLSSGMALSRLPLPHLLVHKL